MLKPSTDRTNACNYINSVLMAIMTILQFIPFWNVNGTGYSISQYVWFAYEHNDLENYLKDAIGSSYDLTANVLPSVIIIACCILGIFFCLKYRDNDAPGLFALAAGVAGIICFLARPVYQLGSLRILYLVLSIALTIVSVISVISLIGWLIEKCKNM